MERFNIDSNKAGALLSRLSQTQNVRLRDLATELAYTRCLPTGTK